MAKKPLDLMKDHTSGDRSARTCVMSQSSSMAHKSSHGPSRNACSASVSVGTFADISFCQSGPPVKILRPTIPCRHPRLRVRWPTSAATFCGSCARRAASPDACATAAHSTAAAGRTERKSMFHHSAPSPTPSTRGAKDPARRNSPRGSRGGRPESARRPGIVPPALRNRPRASRQAIHKVSALNQPANPVLHVAVSTPPRKSMLRLGPRECSSSGIRSFTPSRSSSNSRCVACIFPRLKSLMSNP